MELEWPENYLIYAFRCKNNVAGKCKNSQTGAEGGHELQEPRALHISALLRVSVEIALHFSLSIFIATILSH